ncbi:hypothetical protein ACFX2A_033974 [Malus domestica]
MVGRRASWIWSNLLEGNELLLKEVDREMHVASVIHPVDDIWDWESMRNLISEEDCMEVSNIQVDDS